MVDIIVLFTVVTMLGISALCGYCLGDTMSNDY